MKKRQSTRFLPLLLAVLLLLSSCAPAAAPGVPQTAPQTASGTEAPEESSLVPSGAESTAESVPETTPVPATKAPLPRRTTAAETEPPECVVSFSSAYGEAPEAQTVKAGNRLTEPEAAEVPGKTFEGWYLEGIGGKWNFDEDTVTKSMTLTAVYTDPVPRAASKLNLRDIGKSSAVMEGTNAAVVIYIGFTDGYVCDREMLENFFTAEYGQEQALESVSTYFRYNSYGNVSFDWYFYYYESGMSCKEAFDVTEYEDPLTSAAFAEFQRNFQGDPKDLDRNGDGYVDLLYFVTGEDSSKTKGDGGNYYIYGGASPTASIPPNLDRPVMHSYSKVPYEDWLSPLKPAMHGANRVLLHETGHLFGLEDYYNAWPYEDEDTYETLGEFDMQSLDFSDWNVYSRFACGWISPYVIDGSEDEVTIRLGCSSEVPDAVLIPTAAGWNGTAFDEYILIDVLAPYAAAGFDWPMLINEIQVEPDDPRMQGGVRVYHVDGRLARIDQFDMASNRPATSYEELLEVINDKDFRHGIWLWNRHYNSDGLDPVLPGDSRFHHLIEIVPSDGSKRFRHNEHKMYWQAEDTLTVTDLYGPGDVFSMEKCADAFAEAPLMNNGSTLDYEVRVDFYDPEAREAIITVRKIR